MDSEIEPILQESSVINKTDLLNKPKNKNKGKHNHPLRTVHHKYEPFCSLA